MMSPITECFQHANSVNSLLTLQSYTPSFVHSACQNQKYSKIFLYTQNYLEAVFCQVVLKTSPHTHAHRHTADTKDNQKMHRSRITTNLLKLMFVNSVSVCIYFNLRSVLWHCWLGSRKGIRPVKNGWWWRWALVSPDGVAPSRMVGVSASVNLPLHHKVQKFSSGTAHPGGPEKRAVKRLWSWWWYLYILMQIYL